MTTSTQSHHDHMLAVMHKDAVYAAKSALPHAPARQLKITSDKIFIDAISHAIGIGRFTTAQKPCAGGNSPARPASYAQRVKSSR